MHPSYRAPSGKHEIALVAVCEDALRAYEAGLAGAGLVAKLRGVADVASGGVEVTIDFEGTGGIADVLEFLIAKEGQPTLNEDELRAWLDEVLPGVIER